MNRSYHALFLAVGACLLFAAASASSRADDPPAKGQMDLQGTWKLMSLEVKGKTTDPIGGGQPRWTIKGDKVFYGGKEIATLKIDASTSPRIVDLKLRDPERVYEGIYVVEKNTLKICLNRQSEGTKDRPGKFSTKDQEDWRMLVFEQEKDVKGESTDGLAGYVGLQLGPVDNEVVVKSPLKGAPAEKAGFKQDDVILKVGGVAVGNVTSAVDSVRKAKPGEKLEFRIRRGKEESNITITVGVLPFQYVVDLG